MGSIYSNMYNLIVNQLFNGSVVTGSNEELITILFSTFYTMLLIALPFIVVVCLIKFIINRM